MSHIHSLKAVTSFLLGVGLFSTGYAQAEWIKNYSADVYDTGSMTPAKEGGYYLNLNSSAKSSGAKQRSLLSLLDESGNPTWVKQISTGNYDSFFVGELSNKKMFLQGNTETTATAKTNTVWALYSVNSSTGALSKVFSKTWKAKGDDYLIFTEASQGRLIGTGMTTSFNKNGKNDMVIAEINTTTGQPIWSKVYDYAGRNDSVISFIAKGSNRFILLGSSEAADRSNQKLLIGETKNDGVFVAGTVKAYGNTEIITASGIKPISGGNYLVYGTLHSNGTDQYSSIFVMKLNSNLALQWVKEYNAGDKESLSLTEVNENANKTLSISASLSATQYINIGGFPIPVGVSVHPTAIQLSANGLVTGATSYAYQSADGANWSQLSDGNYLLAGSTAAALDPTKPQVIPNTDMLYGHFDNQLTPNWVKTFATDAYDSGRIQPHNDGYVLNAMMISGQGKIFDVASGKLDSNGDVPGCDKIEEVTMTESSPTITETDLNWKAAPAAIKKKGVVIASDIALKVTNASITATSVCGN